MGLLAFLVMLVGYVPYVLSIFKGRTKPSRVSWWIWTLLGAVNFASYWQSGAIETMWVHGIIVVGPLTIALLSVRHGMGGSSRLDRFTLIGCALSLVLWGTTGSAVLGLFFNLLVDSIAAIPTVWKAWQRPDTENLPAWLLSLLGYGINLFAIKHWTPFTASYPVYLVLLTLVIIGAILLGRRQNSSTVLHS